MCEVRREWHKRSSVLELKKFLFQQIDIGCGKKTLLVIFVLVLCHKLGSPLGKSFFLLHQPYVVEKHLFGLSGGWVGGAGGSLALNSISMDIH